MIEPHILGKASVQIEYVHFELCKLISHLLILFVCNERENVKFPQQDSANFQLSLSKVSILSPPLLLPLSSFHFPRRHSFSPCSPTFFPSSLFFIPRAVSLLLLFPPIGAPPRPHWIEGTAPGKDNVWLGGSDRVTAVD